MKFVTYLSRIMWALLFVGIFLFARKNDELVTLHPFPGVAWEAPLALMLFAAFALGALLGALAGLSRWFRQRGEVLRLRRELRDRGTEPQAKP